MAPLIFSELIPWHVRTACRISRRVFPRNSWPSKEKSGKSRVNFIDSSIASVSIVIGVDPVSRIMSPSRERKTIFFTFSPSPNIICRVRSIWVDMSCGTQRLVALHKIRGGIINSPHVTGAESQENI